MAQLLHRKKPTHSAAIAAFACILFAVPALTLAAPVLRSGEAVSVDAGQFIEGDFYGFGNAVTVSGEVTGDAYIAGGTVTVNAPVSTDLVIAGGSVQVHGPVGDDLRIVGGEVTLASDVQGDVVVAGGVLRVLSTATISGDLLLAGGDVRVEGAVDGSVFGYAEVMRIDGSVGGDVTVRADRSITLGDRANIGGNVSYRSTAELVRAQGSVVEGSITTEQIEETSRRGELILVPLIMMLFAALTLMLLMRGALYHVVDDVRCAYGQNGLIGLGVFFVTPFLAVILMFSILGFIAGLTLFFAYLALLLVSFIVSGVVLGSAVLQLLTKSWQVTFASVVVGIFLLELLLVIPVFGPLAVLALLLIVLGSITKRAYQVLA